MPVPRPVCCRPPGSRLYTRATDGQRRAARFPGTITSRCAIHTTQSGWRSTQPKADATLPGSQPRPSATAPTRPAEPQRKSASSVPPMSWLKAAETRSTASPRRSGSTTTCRRRSVSRVGRDLRDARGTGLGGGVDVAAGWGLTPSRGRRRSNQTRLPSPRRRPPPISVPSRRPHLLSLRKAAGGLRGAPSPARYGW
jgi:hypothetical protein